MAQIQAERRRDRSRGGPRCCGSRCSLLHQPPCRSGEGPSVRKRWGRPHCVVSRFVELCILTFNNQIVAWSHRRTATWAAVAVSSPVSAVTPTVSDGSSGVMLRQSFYTKVMNESWRGVVRVLILSFRWQASPSRPSKVRPRRRCGMLRAARRRPRLLLARLRWTTSRSSPRTCSRTCLTRMAPSLLNL